MLPNNRRYLSVQLLLIALKLLRGLLLCFVLRISS
jgi:hypothetical protein